MQSQRGTLTLQTQGIVCARAFIDYVVQSEPRGNGFVFLIFSNSCSADRAYVTEKTSSRRATWRMGTTNILHYCGADRDMSDAGHMSCIAMGIRKGRAGTAVVNKCLLQSKI